MMFRFRACPSYVLSVIFAIAYILYGERRREREESNWINNCDIHLLIRFVQGYGCTHPVGRALRERDRYERK